MPDKIREFLELMSKVNEHSKDADQNDGKGCKECGSSICAMVQKANDLLCYKKYIKTY